MVEVTWALKAPERRLGRERRWAGAGCGWYGGLRKSSRWLLIHLDSSIYSRINVNRTQAAIVLRAKLSL